MADARLKAANTFGEAEVSGQPETLENNHSRVGRLRAEQKASWKMNKRILELDRGHESRR